VNGVVYAVGGWNGVASLGTVEAYDPAGNSWTTEASMPTAHHGFGASVVNGILYAVGGYNGSSYLATVEAFTPTPPYAAKCSNPSIPMGQACSALNVGSYL